MTGTKWMTYRDPPLPGKQCWKVPIGHFAVTSAILDPENMVYDTRSPIQGHIHLLGE